MDTVRRRTLALIATSLGFAVVQLDVSVVNVAISPIRAEFGGSVSGVQWVVNAYTVVFAALILSAGALGDRIGAKRVFVAGFAVFTIASLGCGLAPSLAALIGFRVLQGVGAAVLVPCSLTVLRHAFPDGAARARAVGLWAAGASVGISGGPVVGGVLTELLSWRWVFFINLPLGALGIVLTLRYADETTRAPDRRFDPAGQVLGTAALALLAAAMTTGGQLGFASTWVLVGFGAAFAAGLGFVVVESRGRHPVLPPALFRSRTFSVAAAIGVGINVAFYGLIFVLSLYFQNVQGRSPLLTGLAFVPMTALVLVANIEARRLDSRFGDRRVVVAASILMAAGLAGLFVAAAGTPYLVLVGPLVAVGVGLGVIVPVITTAMLGSVDADRSGVASGTLNTGRQTGSVIGVSLFGAFAATDVVSGLHRSILISLVLAVVVAGLGLLLARRTGPALTASPVAPDD